MTVVAEKQKPKSAKRVNKGRRPRKKPPEFHEGDTAAARFAAGMRFAIAGGPEPSPKK